MGTSLATTEGDIQRRDLCLKKLRSAAGKLRRALYKGSLIAWGSRITDDPINGPPRQKLLPDDWPPGVEIDFDGHVRERGGWDWGIRRMALSFDTEEVLAVCSYREALAVRNALHADIRRQPRCSRH
jgi:hypothetical protein